MKKSNMVELMFQKDVKSISLSTNNRCHILQFEFQKDVKSISLSTIFEVRK